jgi:hypothetical protein
MAKNFLQGSGSTYIYGHCDATFKEGMTKDECYKFVANGKFVKKYVPALLLCMLFQLGSCVYEKKLRGQSDVLQSTRVTSNFKVWTG